MRIFILLMLLAYQGPSEIARELNQDLPVLASGGRLYFYRVQPPVDKVIPEGKQAFLTFDDGSSEYTRDILQVLAKYNIKATFFVNGTHLVAPKTINQEIVAAGHALANHTFTHNYSNIYASPEAFLADVNQLEELLIKETGLTTRILRFPGGSNNTVADKNGPGTMDAIKAAVTEKGYVFYDWNVYPGDSDTPPQIMVQRALSQATGKETAIILLHDHRKRPETLQALPKMIEGLQAQGFKFYALNTSVPPYLLP